MLIPLSWLNDYVELTESPKAIGDRLTFSGIEVEGIETIGSAFEHFVVGVVRSKAKHPNADKLSVCQVFDGTQELQIVCGAPNVAEGGTYPLARIGATVPNGGFVIKKAKLRGVESNGMLCAADELGLSSDHAGLLTLDPKWPAGTPLSTVLGPPDTVFELEITPNRPDCLSLIGVARELAALYRQALKIPQVQDAAFPISDFRFPIGVDDAEGCPRYTARLLRNVKIAPSPDWMQRRLERAGIRPINNVVDITNYVMLETGHPLHAFDYTLLEGGSISVRRARAGEKLATLDGQPRELTPNMLVIADAAKPVAVAGVMGGAGSEIRDTTTTVLLESACFKASDVRATARALGLSTESSYRFERGVDPATVDFASRRACALLVELAGAEPASDLVDVYPRPAAPRTVTVRFDRVRAVVGVEASDAEIRDCLAALGLPLDAVPGGLAAHIPTFRNDLEAEIDLIEEFARLYGLDRIPVRPSRAQAEMQCDDRPIRALSALRGQLVGLGLREVVHYSLVDDPLLNLFNKDDAPQRVALPRPVTTDQSVLRTSLAPQMVATLGRNRAHQIESAALFEIGRAFQRDADGKAVESTRLCIGLMGPVGRTALEQRAAVKPEEMFLWAKGMAEQLAAANRLGALTTQAATLPWAEAGTAVALHLGGRPVGVLGLVKAAVRREWRLHDPVAVLDLDANAWSAAPTRAAQCQPLPAHPSVQRDVAMICADAVPHEQIVAVMRAAGPRELEAIQLFDIFRGEAIGRGRKSVAYSLTYRAADRSLTDEAVNGYHDTVKAALKAQLQVEIRDS